MNPKKMLATQYGFFYKTLRSNLSGMDAERSIAQPSPAGNCANWIVAHLVEAQNGVMGLVEEGPVWEDLGLEGLHDNPVTSTDKAFDWDTMVERLLSSEERFMLALHGLSVERLDDEGFVDPFGNELTRGESLNLMAVHQHYHAGQLGLSRRLAGLPGAIGAPEPREAQA